MLGLLIGAAVASQLIDTVKESIDTVKDSIQESKIHNMQDMVFINQGASGFYQKNYMDVIHSLLGMGFYNVNAVEIRQHKQGFFTRQIYGQVQSVSINGNDHFSKGERYARGAHVVVSFHVFKDSPHVVIPELEHRYEPYPAYDYNSRQTSYASPQPFNINVNIDSGGSEYRYNAHSDYERQRTPENEAPRLVYCEYCGSPIPEYAAFCPRCGGAVRR